VARAGKLAAYQAANSAIMARQVTQTASRSWMPKGSPSTRVLAAENRANMHSQVEQLVAYCVAKGYQIHQVVREHRSGVNDSRPKFLNLLADPLVTVIFVEHKDRATRFGFRYLNMLLE
jgi:predicted site-specific integrase-resolvase